MKTYDHQIPDPPVVWWLFPFVMGGAIGLLCSLSVRTQSAEYGAEYGAELQRRCEQHCVTAGLGHGTAEPRADACVCEQGGSQP